MWKIGLRNRQRKFGHTKPNPRRKNKNVSPVAASVRKQRTSQERRRRFLGVVIWLRKKAKLGLIIAGAIVLLIAIVGVVSVAHTAEVYKLEEIVVLGNSQITDLEIISALQHYIGTSLWLTPTTQVETELREIFPFLRAVYVRKLLPGKLEVRIVERFPVMAYVNLSGAYLVDEDNVVISQLGASEAVGLNDDELLVVSGYGDVNAAYVYEKYRAGIESEEERDKVVWEEVPEAEKKQALESLRQELLIRVKVSLEFNSTLVAQSGVVDLPLVLGYDADVWDPGQKLRGERYLVSKGIIDYMAAEALSLVKLEWQTDFTVVATLAEGVQIFFTSTKPIEGQLWLLDTVRQQAELIGVTSIDVRGELVAVR